MVCGCSLFSGCSKEKGGSDDNSATKGGSGNGNASQGLKKPENLVSIEGLFDKYNNDDGYQELVGTKVSITGYVENVSRSSVDGDLSFTIKSKKDLLAGRMMKCYFTSTSVLAKCLPGQKVLIEGEVCDKENAFLAGIKDCELINIEGDSNIKVFSTADIEQGKTFEFLDRGGILTGKVASVAHSENDEDHFFVDLESSDSLCVQFYLRKHPDAAKIKALKAGDSLKVFGSTTKSSTRKNYKGTVVLYSCELLD